jgi:hypothetical protein
MMLGKIVGTVRASFSPIDKKLALADAVPNPIKTHVHGFGAFLSHAVFRDTGSRAVVSLDGCRRLRMAKFGEAGA